MAFRAFLGVEARDLPAAGPLLREVEALPADLKVVPEENLHVTLAFLGPIDPTAVPALLAAVRDAAAGEAPFKMEARGVGTFPPRGPSRVVWVGLRGADALARIVERLRPRLTAMGLRTEDRPFSAHLTIARARSGKGAEAVRRFAQEQADRTVGAIAVRRIVLFESRLSPQGPTYHAAASVPLEALA